MGNHINNELDHCMPKYKEEFSDLGPALLTREESASKGEKEALGEELSNDNPSSFSGVRTNGMDHVRNVKRNEKKSKRSQKGEQKIIGNAIGAPKKTCKDDTEIGKGDIPGYRASNQGAEDIFTDEIHHSNDLSSFGKLPNGHHRKDGLNFEKMEFPETVVFKFIRNVALSVAKASADWIERHKASLFNLKNYALKAYDLMQVKIQHIYPIVFRWIKHFGRIMLLLFMAWVECTIRGFDSFLRMGTTSFFSIFWCSALSLIAMAGTTKFLIVLAIAAAIVLFLGLMLALIFISIAGMIFLWIYGSFWTTGLVIFLGGLAFLRGHDRIALSITSVYSVYCALNYVGWLGLVLSLNLSFISSDVLLFFLRTVIKEQRIPNSSTEQGVGAKFRPTDEPLHASSTETDAAAPHADRGPVGPSMRESDSELTSEDEVARLLNCTDHYAALGVCRSENIDTSVVKREYRKRAMLVHPDKNMGNEKSAEAFQKLQNAYEVLMDSLKRKEYEDQLRREELLNYFRRFQNVSHEAKGSGLFATSSGRADVDDEELMLNSRRIACKKCGLLHIWVYTKKIKSRARWCQDCKDYHPAKDGDGWVEQSSHPLFFGMLQKVDTPSAYICSDSKVYDATEWYLCQGMRCAANTHKPTFQVNTGIVHPKNSHTKVPSSGQRGGARPNPEETMSEEEFFEWLQNSMQNGMFENFAGGAAESPSGHNYKGGGSESSKRKKKGKKQR